MAELGTHFTDFCGILYSSVFKKSVGKFKFIKNITRTAGTLHEAVCKFMDKISLNSS
jgi:hypothetical protein